MSHAPAAIDHAYVERNNLLARYRARQLAPEEAEAFEIHYLDCAECRRALEEDDALAAGFKAAAEDGLLAAKSRWLPAYAVAASVLIIVLAGLLLRDAEPTAPTSPSRAQIVPLLTVRDGAPADVPVSLAEGPELVVFVIDAIQPELARYDVTVVDAANRILWSESDLTPRPTLGAERLTVAIPSTSLTAGRLRLTVTGRTAEGAAARPTTFALSVNASR